MSNSSIIKGIFCTWCFAVVSAAICYFHFYQSKRNVDFILFLTASGALTLIQLIGTFGYIIKNAFLLSIHLISNSLISIIISFFWSLNWSHLISKCNMEQIHFIGCDDCNCAATSTCNQEDLDANGACNDCKAIPKDLCNKLDDDLTKIANHTIWLIPLLMLIPIILAMIEVIDIRSKKWYKLMKTREKIKELENNSKFGMYDIDIAELKDMYEFLKAFGDASDKEIIKKIKLKLEKINTEQEEISHDDRIPLKSKNDIESNIIKEVDVKKTKKTSTTTTMKPMKKNNKIIHSSQGIN